MSGDVGAEVAAVLAAHAGPRQDLDTHNWRCACGALMAWPNRSTHRAHVAAALAPLIAERVEAAQAEGESLGWQIAHDEVCARGQFCSAHQPIAGRRAAMARAAALDPGPRPDPRHEGKSPAEWLFAEGEG